MSFNENNVNKVNTIVKYSKVIIQDIDEQLELKGVVGDFVEYPEVQGNSLELKDSIVVHTIFDKFYPYVKYFCSEDKTVELKRRKIEHLINHAWTTNNKSVTIVSECRLGLKFKQNTDYEVLINIEENKTELGYNYILTFELDLNLIEENTYITIMFDMFPNDRVEQRIESEIVLEVNVSTSPQGV